MFKTIPKCSYEIEQLIRRSFIILAMICIRSTLANDLQIYQDMKFSRVPVFASKESPYEDLLPSRLPSPPPIVAGISWATATDGRAVVVVDLGDAERWLRPLHQRARAPLLLWRAPLRPRRAAAPPWLEKQRGYLLTTKSAYRVWTFLAIDCWDVVPELLYEIVNRGNRNLQLDSRAPVVVSIARDEEHPIHSLASQSENRTHRDRTILTTLHDYHQTYRGLLFREARAGKWVARYVDRSKLNYMPRTVRYLVKMALVKETPRTAAKLIPSAVKKTDRDLNGASIPTFFPAPDINATYELTVLNELAKRLNLRWYIDGRLRDKERSQWESFKNGTASYYEEHAKLLLEGIIDGDIAYTPEDMKSIPETKTILDIVPASMKRHKYVLAVPRAPLLPTWSLPLRVFSRDVWVGLLGCMVAYALAWRVVARESLAGSVVAALRAFSSCGGAAQVRVSTTPQRLQLAGALLGSAVVIVVLYQGRLFTLMSHPQHYSEIDSLQRLADSGLPLMALTLDDLQCIASADAERFSGQHLEVRKHISKMKTRTESLETILRLVQQRQRFAWVVSEKQWLSVNTLFRLSDKFHVLEVDGGEFYTMKNARWNWPWTNSLNTQILRFHASGLINYWRKITMATSNNNLKAIREAMEEYSLVGPNTDSVVPRVFELGDMKPHGELLGAGLLLASLTFIMEWLVERQLKRYKRRISKRSRKVGNKKVGDTFVSLVINY